MIGSYGYREAQHFENYRTPSKISGGTTSMGRDGLSASRSASIPRKSSTRRTTRSPAACAATSRGFHYDLSGTYGGNNEQVYTVDSANAFIFAQAARPVGDADRAADELLRR